MTVYVDDMKASFNPKHRPGRTYTLSHMIADTEEELHAMAARCGVARRWYQRDHYDVAQSVRARAIGLGAVPITMRQCSAMACLRRAGQPIGTPEGAEDRWRALLAERKAERAAVEATLAEVAEQGILLPPIVVTEDQEVG